MSTRTETGPNLIQSLHLDAPAHPHKSAATTLKTNSLATSGISGLSSGRNRQVGGVDNSPL
jgi:hypothetical protein